MSQPVHLSPTKKHRCDICLEKFSNTSDLKLHKHAHTNERIYTCRGCQKKYIGTSGLRNHWKRSNCDPHSIEGLLFSDLNGSDVEGNNLVNNFNDETNKCCSQQIWRTRRRK